jgi:hypothetical protein
MLTSSARSSPVRKSTNTVMPRAHSALGSTSLSHANGLVALRLRSRRDRDLLVQGSELQALLTEADLAGEAMLVRGLGKG